MDKRMTLPTFSDELVSVRAKKKELLEQIDRIVPWGGMVHRNQAVLLYRRARNNHYELELMLRINVLHNL